LAGGNIVFQRVYAELKVSQNWCSACWNTYENISLCEVAIEFGDSILTSVTTCKAADAGVIVRSGPHANLYLGLGVTGKRHLCQFYDGFRILGTNWKYWVEDWVDYGINV
jgi:hypothetical protein